MRKILVVTTNMNKRDEIAKSLQEYELLTLADIDDSDDPEEFGLTFEQNALIKAQYFKAKYPEYFVLADDSGLCVEALGGKPGIHSARFSGVTGKNKDEANNQKLIDVLAGQVSNAYFQTSLCFIGDGDPMLFSGRIYGKITGEIRGTNGHGYDPLFVLETNQTLAELSLSQKNQISHRAVATKKLIDSGVLNV